MSNAQEVYRDARKARRLAQIELFNVRKECTARVAAAETAVNLAIIAEEGASDEMQSGGNINR